VSLKNKKNGERYEHPIDGVFLYNKLGPLSVPFTNLGILNSEGYIPTNENRETKIPGIYAAVDIREKELRQIVTATSDGSIAAERAQAYIEELKEKAKSTTS